MRLSGQEETRGPLFTVVTPSFNQARFLPRTLDSVAAQIDVDIEHLVIDPGSTDGSQQMATAHVERHPFARTIFGRDRSQTHAINLGFREARGEILTWLNSDDHYPDPDVLAAVAAEFRAHPEADVVYGWGEYTDPDGNLLRRAFVHRDAERISERFRHALGILQPALFMRRKVFERIGPLDESLDYSFDYEYWVRAAETGQRFHFLDRSLARAVIHSDAKTIRDRDRSLAESVDIARRAFGWVSADWVRRVVDHERNASDGILRQSDLDAEGEVIFARRFASENGNPAAIAAFLSDRDSWKPDDVAAMRQLFRDHIPRIVVTAFDENYFDQGMTLLASLHRHAPGLPILVFDLGLAPDQRAILGGLRDVIPIDDRFSPMRYDWQRMPKNYVYKNVVFQAVLELLPEEAAAIWVDAGVLATGPLDGIFERLDRDGVFFIDHSDSRHWPIFNASFTSDSAIAAGQVTWHEAGSLHLCSCLFGAVRGHPAAAVFRTAAELAADADVALGDKHPARPVFRDAEDKSEQSAESDRLRENDRPVDDLERLRRIFGYYGHRQDQTILSILAARHRLPLSPAHEFCPATEASSRVSKENWHEGVSSTIGDHAAAQPPLVPEDARFFFHHRGLVKDFSGLSHLAAPSGAGRPAAILGNGPSLRDVDLQALAARADCFGMNAAYRHWHEIGWYPSYYSCLDEVVGLSHKEAILDLVRRAPELGIRAFLLRDNLVRWLSGRTSLDRVTNFDRIRKGYAAFLPEPVTTGSHTLAWATVLGFRRAVVIGVDCNYVERVAGAREEADGTLAIAGTTDANPNYYFSGYQRVGDRYNPPNPSRDLHLRSWRRIAEALPEDVEVFNCGEGSKMDAFPLARLVPTLDLFALADAPLADDVPSADLLLRNPDGAFAPASLAAVTASLAERGAQGVRALLLHSDPHEIVGRAIERGEDGDSGACLLWPREAAAAGRLPDGIRLAGPLAAAPRPGSVLQAVAGTFLAADREARHVFAELRPEGGGPRPSAALGAWRALQDRIRTAEEEAATARQAEALAQAQVEQLQGTLETYWHDAEAVRAELGAAREEAAALRVELDRIYASKSWRVTGPLRGARRWAGGGPPVTAPGE